MRGSLDIGSAYCRLRRATNRQAFQCALVPQLADNRLIDLWVTAGPGELLRVLSESRSLVLCRFNVLVQAQAAVRALTQALGSPSDLRDRWPPSCLWASAHDGDVGELSKTPAASRTTQQSKQLRSIYPHQGHTE